MCQHCFIAYKQYVGVNKRKESKLNDILCNKIRRQVCGRLY